MALSETPRSPWYAPFRELPPATWLSLALLGFASGLPLFLTGSTLKAWMTKENLDLGTIGIFSVVTLPYSLKVFWAPFLDRFAMKGLGRRRSWMLLMQIGMALALTGLALHPPHLSLTTVAALAVAVALTSATFDIAVDAWRAEALPHKLLGFGTSVHITTYRIAMLVSGGGALILAQRVGWKHTYLVMAGLTVLGMAGTLLAANTDAVARSPRTLREAILEPLKDLLKRPGIAELAAFAVLYKLGDWLAEAMTMPFLLRGMGFTLAQVGTVQKTTAMAAIIVGGLLGGAIITRVSLKKALFAFGLLQAASILGFWAISRLGPNLGLLVAANALENLAYGMGGSAFAALLMASCNRTYTGTQYALFSSLMALPRTVFAGATGFLAQRLGWSSYFLVCVLAAIPGLLLLLRYEKWGLREEGETTS
ncbi:MAG: AmpG family muropeptide MFS transporter [Firmicutes bacterium]|nr:AmpG family muropeptide MFS transporter [Bacillota bacterium]